MSEPVRPHPADDVIVYHKGVRWLTTDRASAEAIVRGIEERGDPETDERRPRPADVAERGR